MRVRLYFTGALVAATLAGCSGGEPKGQVVAKVGKEEVTLRDLQAELGGFKAPDAKTRKLAEQQALNQIIVRKSVANAALEVGVRHALVSNAYEQVRGPHSQVAAQTHHDVAG